MARFSIPAQVRRSTLVVDRLYGVDYTSEASNVSMSQSPNAPNMIRDEPGKVRKSMGYYLRAQFDGRINGYHKRRGDSVGLVHAGTGLYLMPQSANDTPQRIYNNMNNARSRSWQFEDKLYIADAKTFLVYDGKTVAAVSDNAYIPTLTIAKAPSGGGTDYEPLNLLQPKFKELFAGTKEDTVYHLSFSGLDSGVTVRKLDSGGNWYALSEGTDYTVNRSAGIVTFKTAPGVSPVTGEDNIEITAARTVTGYASRINNCDIGIQFGVNGATDRLFLSGNAVMRNYDWHSGLNDPTYWADTGYSVLGTSKSSIVGYSIISNMLATHKDENEPDRNIVVRQGGLVNSEASFPIVNALQGAGAVAKNSFALLGTEPVFLTRQGIFAVTPSDVSGERYSQNRSYYVNGALRRESGLENACGCVHNDMYWLCLNGHAYILDGLQNMGSAQGEPYSNRQYACFYRENLPAHIMWVDDETLYFGTNDGKVCAFYTDKGNMASYNDLGKPIRAVWETPDFGGKLFYKNKSFRYLAVQLAPAVRTSVEMYAQKRGVWQLLRRAASTARYFVYSQLTYSKFSYSGDSTAQTLYLKTRLKRLDKVRYRFVNEQMDEPFGLMQLAVEYTENGNYKG